jgi:hypothetical protein
MKTYFPFIKTAASVLGLVAISLITFCFFLFESLRPRMVNYASIASSELDSFNWAGVCLLILLLFFSLSVFLLLKTLRSIDTIRTFHYFLIGSGIIAFLMIFADFALLGDIVKQYKHRIDQPEWSLLYPIMAFQLIAVFTHLWFLLFENRKLKTPGHIEIDSNIFQTVNFTGVVCGLMGFGLISLGFFFPRAWSLPLHTIMSSAILITPYLLVTVYWLLIKIRDEHGQFLDEKQIQDLGHSALMTLGVCSLVQIILFIVNLGNLAGILSQLWLPLYLFCALFTFSIENLWHSGKQIE